MLRTLRVHHLGRVEYGDGLRLMDLAAAALQSGEAPGQDYLFLLEHPHVLTMGRGAGRANLLAEPAWLERQGFELHETNRGGDVTYHGPGQIVGYPVLDLSDRPDVRRYVSDLEEAMIRACADHGIAATRHPEHRGAWIGQRKVGAVGVHFSRWITTHGFALNLATDLARFRLIVPCGIADQRLGVTSLAQELKALGRSAPERQEVESRLAHFLGDILEREAVDCPVELHTVSVVPVRADGQVLLLRRSEARGGFWQPVTGRIEPGESPAEAARRELSEETGAEVQVQPLRYRHAFALEPGLSRSVGSGLRLAEETAFVALLPAAFTPRLSAEHVEWGWFAPDEAAGLVPFAGLRRAVRLAAGAGSSAACGSLEWMPGSMPE